MDEKKKKLEEVREVLRFCASTEISDGGFCNCTGCPWAGKAGCINALIPGAEELVEDYERQLADVTEKQKIFAEVKSREAIIALLRCTGEMPDGCLDCPFEDEGDCSGSLIEALGEMFRRLLGPAPEEKEES